MLLVFQDFGQIETNFPKARSIIANAGAVCIFGVRDLATAEQVSKMLGPKTMAAHSQGTSQASTAVIRQQLQNSVAETGRSLLDPSEILRMGDREALVFVDGVRFPARVRKIRYWKEWRFRGHWDRWRAGGPSSLFPAAGTGSAGSPGHSETAADITRPDQRAKPQVIPFPGDDETGEEPFDIPHDRPGDRHPLL